MNKLISMTFNVLGYGFVALSVVCFATIFFLYLVGRTKGLTPDDRKLFLYALGGFFGALFGATFMWALGAS
jgi:hypothetical protein